MKKNAGSCKNSWIEQLSDRISKYLFHILWISDWLISIQEFRSLIEKKNWNYREEK